VSDMPQQLRREFRGQLSALEDGLLTAGGQVLDLLDGAMEALAQGNPDRAASVVASRSRTVEQHNALQEDILRTITLQAPVASDLRLLASFIPVNLHIARMGGLCRNIAKTAAEEHAGGEDPQIKAQLGDMAQHTRRVIERALECFARRDVELARTLPELDDPIDTLNRSIFARTVQLASGEGNFEWVMRMLLVARYLERMSDHAVEVGEQTQYAVTGGISRLS
jgi:phosphate transport system protein